MVAWIISKLENYADRMNKKFMSLIIDKKRGRRTNLFTKPFFSDDIVLGRALDEHTRTSE